MKKRHKVGIVIDYTLRLPNFKESYSALKEQILLNEIDNKIDKKDIVLENNYWQQQAQSEDVLKFYAQTSIPELDNTFDISLQKYFYNKEHLNRFLEEWSYNLYGQGGVTNRTDINIINIAQSKLCDIVLIDLITHTRKVVNTFAFLSRTGLFVKEVRFLTNKELEDCTVEFTDIWNPYENNIIIFPPTSINKPTEKFLEWFEKVEKKIKEEK